jgi:hypothetical protein
VLKSEVVNHRQFFGRKHDLQSLTTEIVHGLLQQEYFQRPTRN